MDISVTADQLWFRDLFLKKLTKANTQLTLACSKSPIETLENVVNIYSKLTIKTPERCHWRRCGVIVNFEHISHLFLVFLLVTLNK